MHASMLNRLEKGVQGKWEVFLHLNNTAKPPKKFLSALNSIHWMIGIRIQKLEFKKNSC
jgi:hypothetical protein